MKLIHCLGCAFFAVLFMAHGASASLILLIDDPAQGGIEVIIGDNLLTGTAVGPYTTNYDDADPFAGNILLGVPVDTSDWQVEFFVSAFGIGGGSESAIIDLFFDATSKLPGMLTATVVFTDVNLDFPLSHIKSAIGGGTSPGDGTVDFSVGFDDANGWTPAPVISVPGLQGSFGDERTVPVTGSSPFSLSITTKLTATESDQNFYFDASGETNSAVPEPASLMLFGGLFAVALGLSQFRGRPGKRSDTPATLAV